MVGSNMEWKKGCVAIGQWFTFVICTKVLQNSKKPSSMVRVRVCLRCVKDCCDVKINKLINNNDKNQKIKTTFTLNEALRGLCGDRAAGWRALVWCRLVWVPAIGCHSVMWTQRAKTWAGSTFRCWSSVGWKLLTTITAEPHAGLLIENKWETLLVWKQPGLIQLTAVSLRF